MTERSQAPSRDNTGKVTRGRGVRSRRQWSGALVLAVIAALLTLTTGAAEAQGGARLIVREGESIQAAIDAASPGTTIIVYGHHTENVWIGKNGISLIGRDATLTMPDDPMPAPCGFPGGPEIPAGPESLICVTSDGSDLAPPQPSDYINAVTVKGFTLEGGDGDSIATVFANNVVIRQNKVMNAGCDGIFVIFSTWFSIAKNEVMGAGCNGIAAVASQQGRIARNEVSGATNSGISAQDTGDVKVRRNNSHGNCIGIAVGDGADGGFGIRDEDFSADRVRVTNNTTSENNRTCPFGPLQIGLVGILIAGMDDVTVRYNTANDNVSDAESLTAGGIVIVDFPNADGSVNQTTDVTVVGNRATGNSSAAGPVDLTIVSEEITRVARNRCDVSVPDPSWCG